MRNSRENAYRWHVMPDKIAVIGFSAGGHLAGAAATMGRRRPAAAILGYAVLRRETALELGKDMPGIPNHVDENTPPCFLFASRTDSVVPIQNTLDMMEALNRYHTSFECHIYAYGPHGFSTGDHSVQSCETRIPARASGWAEDSVSWLKDLFGDFGYEGLTEPVLRPHVNDDALAWLSLDCSISRIWGNPRAREVLSETIEKMRERITPFTPEMTFEDMMEALGRMTLRDLLIERGIDTDRLDRLNGDLGRMTAILVYVAGNTKYGKKIYAIGSNFRAAKMSGINVSLMKISAFTICGILTGLGAFLWIAMNGSADPATTGSSYEMYAIASVVLGGIAMSGGRGKMLGVLFGAMSYTIVDKIIVALKMDSLINNAIKGIILILVILVQVAGPQIREKFRKAS